MLCPSPLTQHMQQLEDTPPSLQTHGQRDTVFSRSVLGASVLIGTYIYAGVASPLKRKKVEGTNVVVGSSKETERSCP